MNNWDGLNRRKNVRVRFPSLIILKSKGGEKEILLTHTENIGIGGVCVILKKQIELGSHVEMEIDLLDMDNHIKCKGEVVWSIQRQDSEEQKPFFYDTGVEFSCISDEERQRILEIIKRLNKPEEEI